MMRKYRKSIVGATAIVVGVAIYVFVIAIVLAFFYFFKFQITLVMQEQYLWNKIQDVPMDLLSMDLDGESFVYRMNKVYYEKADKDQLRDEIEKTISKQLFYFFEGIEYPLDAVIHVGGIEITEYLTGCGCYKHDDNPLYKTYSCTSNCPDSRKGERCFKETMYTIGGPYARHHKWCTGVDLVAKRHYSAEFPFPLTFNGTDKFVDELSYEIVEKK